jgi:uncharacterized Zn-binding protein involved in type VI secretion
MCTFADAVLPVPGVPTPHGAGFIEEVPCTVMIGFQPAARVGSVTQCPTGSEQVGAVIKGSLTVLILDMPAARMGDMHAHGGTIVMGCPTVLIGD